MAVGTWTARKKQYGAAQSVRQFTCSLAGIAGLHTAAGQWQKTRFNVHATMFCHKGRAETTNEYTNYKRQSTLDRGMEGSFVDWCAELLQDSFL